MVFKCDGFRSSDRHRSTHLFIVLYKICISKKVTVFLGFIMTAVCESICFFYNRGLSEAWKHKNYIISSIIISIEVPAYLQSAAEVAPSKVPNAQI